MSFATPERGSGVALARLPANFASFRALSSALRVCAFVEPPQKMGVAIAPGEIEFTRMPLGPSFAPAIRVIWLTAAFAAREAREAEELAARAEQWLAGQDWELIRSDLVLVSPDD